MKVVISGSTGMVGKGVALECIDDPLITDIVLINRSPSLIEDPKVTEVLHQDFFNLNAIKSHFADMDACLFCMGVSSAGMSEKDYGNLTYDLTTYFAQIFLEASPKSIFTYVSGEGTDSSENGRSMWARVKGRTENAIMDMDFSQVYVMRPGYIHPMRGVRSRTKLYALLYDLFGLFYPLIKRLAPNKVTTSVNLGLANIELLNGYNKRVLHAEEINDLAERNLLRRSKRAT